MEQQEEPVKEAPAADTTDKVGAPAGQPPDLCPCCGACMLGFHWVLLSTGVCRSVVLCRLVTSPGTVPCISHVCVNPLVSASASASALLAAVRHPALSFTCRHSLLRMQCHPGGGPHPHHHPQQHCEVQPRMQK
jgi:hypothetical protein